MFYVNKDNKEDVVELIYSDSNNIIVVKQIESLEYGDCRTAVLNETKKEFKEQYKKCKDKNLIKIFPLAEYQKEMIISQNLEAIHNLNNAVSRNDTDMIEKIVGSQS